MSSPSFATRGGIDGWLAGCCLISFMQRMWRHSGIYIFLAPCICGFLHFGSSCLQILISSSSCRIPFLLQHLWAPDHHPSSPIIGAMMLRLSKKNSRVLISLLVTNQWQWASWLKFSSSFSFSCLVMKKGVIQMSGHPKDKALDFQIGTVDPIMNPVTHYGGQAQQLVLNTKYTWRVVLLLVDYLFFLSIFNCHGGWSQLGSWIWLP